MDLEQLKERIVECWEEFPQGEIDKAVDSFRVRLKKCIKNKGGCIEKQ